MFKKLLKSVLFVICLALALAGVSRILCHSPSGDRTYYGTRQFYKEPDNSIDVVMLGASDVYAFYQPILAWNDCGYTSWNFVNSGRPLEVNLDMLKEARKTQPDALYVISLSRTKSSDAAHIHFAADPIPFSRNKLDLINHFCDSGVESESTGWDRLEYIFPLIRYHSAWETIKSVKLNHPQVKSSSTYGSFLKRSKDMTGKFIKRNKCAEPDETLATAVDDIIAYCEDENVKVLFVIMPRCFGSDKTNFLKQCNTLSNTIEAHGMPVLNLVNDVEGTGLDFRTDFYNWKHTNVHGSIKVTDYISQYITENYGFEDKRENPEFKSWNEAYKTYLKKISPYLTDEELALLNK